MKCNAFKFTLNYSATFTGHMHSNRFILNCRPQLLCFQETSLDCCQVPAEHHPLQNYQKINYLFDLLIEILIWFYLWH